jgi:hypothetical protein
VPQHVMPMIIRLICIVTVIIGVIIVIKIIVTSSSSSSMVLLDCLHQPAACHKALLTTKAAASKAA